LCSVVKSVAITEAGKLQFGSHHWPVVPRDTWESGRGAKKRAGLEFNVRLPGEGGVEDETLKVLPLLFLATGVGVSLVIFHSSLGIVP